MEFEDKPNAPKDAGSVRNQYVKFIVHDEVSLAAVERVVSAFI